MNNTFVVYKTLVVRALMEIKEYPSNLWAGFIANSVQILVDLLFYSIIVKLSFEILGWSFYDFSLFFFMAFFTSLFLRFFWIRNLSSFLLSGHLNILLTKPISSYFYISVSSLRGSHIIYAGLLCTVTLILTFVNKDYSNYILAFFSSITGFIVQVLFINMICSLAFFMKKNEFLFTLYYHRLNTLVEYYTPKFFEKTNFSFVMNMFPVAFICYFFVEILNGRTQDFFYYLPYFLLFGVFCYLIIKILWYYGLKKYEAFG